MSPNSIVASRTNFATNSSRSVSTLETKASFSKDAILLSLSASRRVFVGRINEILFKDDSEQSTRFPLVSHQHSSGHSIATLAGCITNNYQNITAGAANISDTNTTVSLDGLASCCNLHREMNCGLTLL